MWKTPYVGFAATSPRTRGQTSYTKIALQTLLPQGGKEYPWDGGLNLLTFLINGSKKLLWNTCQHLWTLHLETHKNEVGKHTDVLRILNTLCCFFFFPFLKFLSKHMKTPYKMRNNRVEGTGCAEKANLTEFFLSPIRNTCQHLWTLHLEAHKNEVGKHTDVLRILSALCFFFLFPFLKFCQNWFRRIPIQDAHNRARCIQTSC